MQWLVSGCYAGSIVLYLFVKAYYKNELEASLLLRHSLLRPRLEESCFTSRPEERPLMYPVFKVFGQFKDMLVRMVNVLAAHAKEAQLT